MVALMVLRKSAVEGQRLKQGYKYTHLHTVFSQI